MVLDRIENGNDITNAKYVIHNTCVEFGSVLEIPKTRAYYVEEDDMLQNMHTKKNGQNEFKVDSGGMVMWLVNKDVGDSQVYPVSPGGEQGPKMLPETWYLFPHAYSITLVPESPIDSSSDSEEEIIDQVIFFQKALKSVQQFQNQIISSTNGIEGAPHNNTGLASIVNQNYLTSAITESAVQQVYIYIVLTNSTLSTIRIQPLKGISIVEHSC